MDRIFASVPNVAESERFSRYNVAAGLEIICVRWSFKKNANVNYKFFDVAHEFGMGTTWCKVT